jgi:hypothetical protein
MKKALKLNILFKFCTQDKSKIIGKKKYINIKKIMNDEK